MFLAAAVWLRALTPSPTIPGHRVALQLRLHSTYADWLRSWDCQSRNQKELLGEGLVSTEEL